MIRDKIPIIILATPVFLVMLACNPVSENVDDPLWNSQHNEKPFKSDYFHSADYRFPQGACDEAQCHGVLLTGGNSGAPSCYKCHDDQWTIFSVSHTRKINGHYHRYDVDDYPADRNSNVDWHITCKDAACHGAALTGIGSLQDPPVANNLYRYSCVEPQCHGGFSAGKVPPPGHSKKKSDDGQTGWHHYKYESADEDGGSGNVTYCGGTACHGADGESSAAASGLFGRSPACSECH